MQICLHGPPTYSELALSLRLFTTLKGRQLESVTSNSLERYRRRSELSFANVFVLNHFLTAAQSQ